LREKFVLIATCVAASGAFVLTGEPPVTPQVYTAAQAAAGRAAYQSTCVKCHTETLRGRKGEIDEMPPLSSLPEEMQKVVKAAAGKVPPLAGPAFLGRWSTRTTKDLSERIKSAVGGFPPENANEETSINLTAYILQANGAQSGTDPLTAATAVPIGRLTENLAQADAPASNR
jgi:cytochrome c553